MLYIKRLQKKSGKREKQKGETRRNGHQNAGGIYLYCNSASDDGGVDGYGDRGVSGAEVQRNPVARARRQSRCRRRRLPG